MEQKKRELSWLWDVFVLLLLTHRGETAELVTCYFVDLLDSCQRISCEISIIFYYWPLVIRIDCSIAASLYNPCTASLGFRKYFITLARSWTYDNVFKFIFVWKKPHEIYKMEPVDKGICSTRIPRNQTVRIFVPNRKKMFNEAMRRTDLTPTGYWHLLNQLVLGLSFLSCTNCGQFSHSSLCHDLWKASRVSDSSKTHRSIWLFSSQIEGTEISIWCEVRS